MKILSFDIEISDIFDLKPGEDIEKYAPFHISVASTAIPGGEEKVWYSEGDDGVPLKTVSKELANDLLVYLEKMQNEGYMVCAWNGLKFDLQWIGYNAGNFELAQKVALRSYDPMFQFFNARGFPVGLGAVAKALRINQEKLMTGDNAPIEWERGNYQLVMDYVLGDSQITNKIVSEIINRKSISWVTKAGKVSSEWIGKLKTVEQVIKEPGPDQSWMSTPMKKESFYSWFR